MRNLSSDDMPCRDIYEDIFFGEVMSPYTAAGLGKIQWAECQVKANCTYLQNISSTKKNLKQLTKNAEASEHKNYLNNLENFLQVCANTHVSLGENPIRRCFFGFSRLS